MTGDYTKVPLRHDERWTGARMQEGRVIVEHEVNLNLDAAARALQTTAAAAIGPAGVPVGSPAFEVSVTPSGTLDLAVEAGPMWVDGLLAWNPAPLSYLAQDQIGALPASGNALVYLDVFEEHVQPAEDPSLVDPALAPTDSAARTRIGYRVRVLATAQVTCEAAWAELDAVVRSSGALTVARASVATATDPCAPPGDPLAQIPDGLLRVEVLNGGPASGAVFAWSYENGATAIPIVQIAGDQLTLAPSHLRLEVDDLVEVSWLARRADRLDHGALYTVANVTPGAGGDLVELSSPVSAPAAAAGLAVRRWDGQVTGATTDRNATYRGQDLGVTFSAGTGTYLPGDWWGVRLRAGEGDGIEHRTAAEPDGTRHAFAPLALVDLGTRAVLHDCRPTFTPLVDIDFDRGSCTISVRPGDDLQAAVDALPPGGGELCFAAGLYDLAVSLQVKERQRILFNGAGPATVLRAGSREAAVVFEGCDEVEVRHLRAEGGSPGAPPGDPHLEGALTFLSCRDVTVADCVLACPDAAGKSQTCLTVRPAPAGAQPDRIRVERNRFEVGAWQAGVLLVDAGHALVQANHVFLPAGSGATVELGGNPVLGEELRRLLPLAVRTGPGPGVKSYNIPGSETRLYVFTGSDVLPLIEDFAKTATAAEVSRAGGAEQALYAFGRSIGNGPGLKRLSPSSLSVLVGLLLSLRAAAQGIVVAGGEVGTIQILDNVVEGAVQGIHVGVSEPGGGRESGESIMLARNVVSALVPVNYGRDRHGIFVGNAKTVHVLDTTASLRRTGKQSAEATPTPVEGIRVHGQLGAFMVVRQSSLAGFAVGVRVVPTNAAVPAQRVWLVAETAAPGAAAAVQAPASVARERNAP
ncbi:MAG TPA: DUF6519 domain-containing protein [Gaiellaceae bacterium]|nr:DUF6519 domain-containing protein [Gaiellaceae bacterium]